MAVTLGRVCVHAKPARNHRTFKEWETADIVVFVVANEFDRAISRATEFLKRQRWEVLSVQRCDRLIGRRIRKHGGEVWELYQQARAEGAAMKVFPKHFAPGPEGIPGIRPPRVTEAFIDTVIHDVGGERLETDDKNRVADYRIGDWLFELKDLQQEGLLQPERQQKLAALFAPYIIAGKPLAITPDLLADEDRRRYFDILSSPIQGQVKSASKQIRSTKQLLDDGRLRGGIIYLNTGYGSFPPEEFGPLVERYTRKDTTQIEALLCVSTWSVTNGFDTEIYFRLYPEESPFPVVTQIQDAFAERFEEALTQLIRGELSKSAELADPLTPVAFTVNGLDFAWHPPLLPLPWSADSGED
ncbi:MAG TPA: hypothetical protein VHA37_00050 [Candidatus Saccharimonadales bacterium]|nr:hypothetical protein [Candidatus Saccharimonadales bacterium]